MLKSNHWLIIAGFTLLIGDILTASDTKPCICQTRDYTTTEKVVMGTLFGVGAVSLGVAAYFLGPDAVRYAKDALDKASPYASKAKDLLPKKTVAKVAYGLTAVQMARPYVIQTTEEKLSDLEKEKNAKSIKAKDNFVDCLIKNKNGSPRNNKGIPTVCEDAALCYALNSNMTEFNARTEAFKKGQCFCD